jgi:pyruvate dehydrogenase E1 component alpha subunit
MYRCMLLARRFDERMLSLHGQGRMGTFAPIKGQEASQVGAVAVLQENDWLFLSFREMAAEIWRGKPLENILLVYAGYYEGGRIPPEKHILPVCIPVGTHLPYAAGMMYAAKYRKNEEVGMVFFGDGATSEGDFHEAMNFAAVFQLPLVFVCQNNQ